MVGMNECQAVLAEFGTWASWVIMGVTAGGIFLIFNAGRGAGDTNRKAPSYELCKLHQRPIDQCRDMHDQDGDLDG